MVENSQDIISMKNLKFLAKNSTKVILEIEQLSLKPDTITVVMGPNGAGKTLFLHIIQGLIFPKEGKIKFMGKSLKEPAKSTISIVMQRPQFLRRTVENNIRFVLRLNRKDSPQELSDVLKRFDLSEQRILPANKLSGGEKQRLALAMAICKDPNILLLDEPTANADPQTTLTVEKILVEEFSLGRKIILVTHDIAQARRISQDVIFIHKGKVIEQNKSKEFFKHPKQKASKQFLSGEIAL